MAARAFPLDYFDKSGRHRTPSFDTEHEAHVHLLKNAGSKSKHQLHQVRLAAIADVYRDLQIERGCCATTVTSNAKRYADRLWRPLGNPAVGSVSLEQLEELAESWRGTMAPSSMRDIAYSMSRLFELAYSLGATQRNDARIAFREMTRLTGSKLTTPADARDVELILENSSLRTKLALNLVMDGFLSEAELTVLSISDFDRDFRTMTVAFRLELGDEVQPSRHSKERTIQLSENSSELLHQWWGREERCPGSPHIFSHPDGRRMMRPVCIHLLRIQHRLGMSRRQPKPTQCRLEPAKRKRKAIQLFDQRWNLGDIADMRVVQWHEQGVGLKEILRRCGMLSVSRLDRFKPFFDIAHRNRDRFDAIDEMLKGSSR